MAFCPLHGFVIFWHFIICFMNLENNHYLFATGLPLVVLWLYIDAKSKQQKNMDVIMRKKRRKHMHIFDLYASEAMFTAKMCMLYRNEW